MRGLYRVTELPWFGGAVRVDDCEPVDDTVPVPGTPGHFISINETLNTGHDTHQPAEDEKLMRWAFCNSLLLVDEDLVCMSTSTRGRVDKSAPEVDGGGKANI